MNTPRSKYSTVVFLLLIFMLSGTVAVFAPFYSYFTQHDQHEMKLVNETGESTEKGTEKSTEIKEFIGHFNDHDLIHRRYLVGAKSLQPRDFHFFKSIFLPIATPPPKAMINNTIHNG